MVEHALYAVDSLVDVLNEEDVVLAEQVERCGQQSAQHGDIASVNSAFSLAKTVVRVGRHFIVGHGAGKDVAERAAAFIVGTFGQMLAHQRVYACHAIAGQRCMEGRDVAESHHPFRVAAPQSRLEMLEQMHHSVSATAAHYGTHRRVGERLTDVGYTLFRRSAVRTVHAFAVPTHHGAESPTLDCPACAVDQLRFDCTCRRENRHGIALS